MPLPDNADGRRKFAEDLKADPGFENLMLLIDSLLGEGGCPWDRERKSPDCPKYIESELAEVVEALESGDDTDLEEELGDLLFMVAFTVKVAEKEGRMSVSDMFRRILTKMVYRHPHVFGGDMDASSPEEVVSNWQELKKKEKSGKGE